MSQTHIQTDRQKHAQCDELWKPRIEPSEFLGIESECDITIIITCSFSTDSESTCTFVP